MNNRQKKLILSLLNKGMTRQEKISERAFLVRFPSQCDSINDLIKRLLIAAYLSRNAQDVEFSLYLGFYFNFSNDDVFLLNKLLLCTFHYRHDEIVRALVMLGSSSKETIEALFNCALSNFNYLRDDREDGIYTLSWNCMYALAKIASPDASDKLMQLSRYNVQEIKEKAIQIISGNIV